MNEILKWCSRDNIKCLHKRMCTSIVSYYTYFEMSDSTNKEFDINSRLKMFHIIFILYVLVKRMFFAQY